VCRSGQGFKIYARFIQKSEKFIKNKCGEPQRVESNSLGDTEILGFAKGLFW